MRPVFCSVPGCSKVIQVKPLMVLEYSRLNQVFEIASPQAPRNVEQYIRRATISLRIAPHGYLGNVYCLWDRGYGLCSSLYFIWVSVRSVVHFDDQNMMHIRLELENSCHFEFCLLDSLK